MNTIESLTAAAYENACRKGFHETTPNFSGERKDVRHVLSLLMLVTTEIAEAAEAVRHGDRNNFEEELADTCIRIFDLCGLLGIDLEAAILRKMAVNESRPNMHGGKRA